MGRARAWTVVGAVVAVALLGAGPAWATAPGLNGRIAFASSRDGGGIFTVRPDGTQLRQLTSGDDGQPAWSPDGRWLAFTRISTGSAPSGIYLVRADGHRLHFLVDGQQASWSGGGHRLVYTGQDAQGNVALAVIRRDGMHQHPLGIQGTDPSWSPQAGVIAFVARTPGTSIHDIYLLRLADHQVTNLTQNRDDPDAGFVEDAGAPDWSPDGTHLAFTQDNGAVSECFDRIDVHTIRVDGTGESLRGNFGPSFLALNPTWAPAGGGRIAFDSRTETEALPECGAVFQDDLVISRPDNTARDITDWSALDEREPAWRPVQPR